MRQHNLIKKEDLSIYISILFRLDWYMAIVIKVASTAAELDDVYRVRYEVYVKEDGKFTDAQLSGERILDRFDAISSAANIIAYDEDLPIATLRLNRDSEVGLPSEEYFDFSNFRNKVKNLSKNPFLVSCGMLAIRKKWRRKRDVIQALFKMAIGIGFHWNTTHSIASVNKDTVSMYGRMGYSELSEPVWIESIGNYIVPMAASYKEIHTWAFSGLLDSSLDRFWLDSFSAHFERILLNPGEVLFDQNDQAMDAYIVDTGWVALSRFAMDDQELVIANLSRGALFGELGLIDGHPRSAKAIASTRVELIRFNRATFNELMSSNPAVSEKLLHVFAQRIRNTDELATVMAYAPQTGRVKFALDSLKQTAVPHKKDEAIMVVKSGPSEIAKTAGVREYEVRRILEMERQEGLLDYSDKWIHFF